MPQSDPTLKECLELVEKLSVNVIYPVIAFELNPVGFTHRIDVIYFIIVWHSLMTETTIITA